MYKLVTSFKNTLFSPAYEIISDYAELGIDALFDNALLKDIPIVNTLTSICKVGYNIHERNLTKQTLAFISDFNSHNISQEKLDEHIEQFNANPEKIEKELGRVLIILGKQIDIVQSKILGSFYASYIKGAVSWEKFCELAEANQRMFVSDYALLSKAATNGGLRIQNGEFYQVDRLISLGLLQNKNRLGDNIWHSFEYDSQKENDITVTSFGMTFYHNASTELHNVSIELNK